MTESKLKSICCKYGSVVSCKIRFYDAANGDKVSTGKAIVSYTSKEAAALALNKLYYEDDLGL